MKTKFRLFYVFILIALMFGCESKEKQAPASEPPTISVIRDELYSTPNRNFQIKAKLQDDLALQSVNISIPQFFLDKTIEFHPDSLVKSYDLDYQFLAPKESLSTDQVNVKLTIKDVSGNKLEKDLKLFLDGDFEAPVIRGLKPANGAVVFRSDDTKLDVSFVATDKTGIQSIVVSIADLKINDVLEVPVGTKEFAFSKSYSVPSDIKSYDLVIKAKDTFIEPNSADTKVNFSVLAGLNVLFLADVDMQASFINDFVTGVPMLFHKKVENDFTFKYYADKDNKQIYFVGQNSGFEPHYFGSGGADGLLAKGSNEPVTLPLRGYYTIVVNPSTLVYTATPYTPTSNVIDLNANPITLCGGGFEKAGWDPNNKDMLLSQDPQNSYRLMREINVNSAGSNSFALTITSPNWGSPFWRLDEYGVCPLDGGANAYFTAPADGVYTFILDTELERSFIIRKK